MRALMYLHKDRHGTYYARLKVPKGLQEAVARVLNNGKHKQVWLKRSLGTKTLSEANVRVKPVLVEFDRTVARAGEVVKSKPVRRSLSAVEIRRMADYTYAASLASHDEYLRVAPEEEALTRQLVEEDEGPQQWSEPVPAFGLSESQLFDLADNLPRIIADAEAALVRGDIGHWQAVATIEQVLEAFQINLDPESADYRKLGLEVLRAHVRALRAAAARAKGEPIETPPLPTPHRASGGTGGSLEEALEGWRKERSPSVGVLNEYVRAVRLFTELHGNIPVSKITRTHARTFREALQELPRHRSTKLRDATLPELAEWGRNHPDAPRITNKTLNKLFGGVQTIARWAFKNGMVPDDVQWSDPFADMRLEEDEPNRAPFTILELTKLFGSPVFTNGERPEAGGGEASFWLPLIALFTGARRGEIASLRAKDVYKIEGVWCFSFVADRAAGKTLKTRSSARVVPAHHQLVALGLLDYLKKVRDKGGESAWLFPHVAPDVPGALKAWTKWFIRHLRSQGVTDETKVFHSFRHLFKDALRRARVPEDLNDALTGHSNATVGRGYGAKESVHRFGVEALKEAVDGVGFKDLDLSKAQHRAGAK
jgi:integrase